MRGFFIIISILSYLQSEAQGDFIDANPNVPSKSLQFYKEDGKMGLQKNSKRQITPAIYDTLISISENRYVGKRFSTNKQQSLWGVISDNGTIVLPFIFYTCDHSESFLILGSASSNRIKKGVYDHNGNELIQPRYEDIKISTDFIVSRIAETNTIFSTAGTKIKEFTADSVVMIDHNYLKIFQDGKVGLETLDGTIAIPSQYKAIKIDKNGVYGKAFPQWLMINGYDSIVFHQQDIKSWGRNFIVSTSDKSQILDREKSIISSAYDAIVPVSNELAKVKSMEKWGVINASGKMIIPITFADVLIDEEFIGVKTISNRSKWYVYDNYGFLKTQLAYDSLKNMSDGRIPIKRNNRWGYLDRYGVEIISPIFEQAYAFKNQIAHVRFFGQSGIIDRSGKWVMVPINKRILDFNEKVVLTQNLDQYQIINYQNELIYFTNNHLNITASGIDELDSTDSFFRKISWEGTISNDIFSGESVRTGGSGLTIFKGKGRYGFKDQQGRIIIANRYDEVKPFHQRMAAIKIRNKWGFIDLDEIIRVQPVYDSVGHFVDGSCLVKKGGFIGVIDPRGNEIIATRYNEVNRLSNNSYKVSIKNKWGIIGENGEVIIHPKYDKLDPTGQGYYIVKKGDKYGSISESGINIIPLMYDYLDFDQKSKTLIIKEGVKQEWAFIMKTHLSN